ncbi:hypothetical protein KUV44_10655 [Marinobacter daepoensis]|uniref:Uncharacterized protein n=1 Tax=Marinobacter daepoensis TaxID=262077 RepID=A0ABS3BF98_9GAMM|nr:hypothetical protein [Marinobacter daepoensis]MBN7770152.1 hypothetical protein [Marinobacter daepoensis]MBY6079598.1 hypothetical protein [Marinobacter daepoensis]
MTRSAACLAALLLTLPLPVQAELPWQHKLADLHDKHINAPETLRWFLPNKTAALPHTEVGAGPDRCSAPIPIRIGDDPQFLVRCEVPQFIQFRRVNVRVVTVWSHRNGDWDPGQIITIKAVDTPASRIYPLSTRGDQFEVVRHRNLDQDAYARVVGDLTDTQADALTEFWDALADLPEDLVTALTPWQAVPWPDGVLALRKNGDLMLREGSLGGTSDLLAMLADGPGLPAQVEGLVQYAPGPWDNATGSSGPMLLLHSFNVNDQWYAIAAADPTQPHEHLQRLNRNGQYDLVFLTLNRSF